MIIINKKLYHTVIEASKDLNLSRQTIHKAMRTHNTRTLKYFPDRPNNIQRWEADENVELNVNAKIKTRL